MLGRTEGISPTTNEKKIIPFGHYRSHLYYIRHSNMLTINCDHFCVISNRENLLSRYSTIHLTTKIRISNSIAHGIRRFERTSSNFRLRIIFVVWDEKRGLILKSCGHSNQSWMACRLGFPKEKTNNKVNNGWGHFLGGYNSNPSLTECYIVTSVAIR